MEPPAVTGARASSDAAYARVTSIPAGTGNVPFRKGILGGASKWRARRKGIKFRAFTFP